MTAFETTVSRKTPKDGKLEIPAEAAAGVDERDALILRLGTARGSARISSLPCTCRGEGERHVHHFLEGELLKSLEAGSIVRVELGVGEATVAPAAR